MGLESILDNIHKLTEFLTTNLSEEDMDHSRVYIEKVVTELAAMTTGYELRQALLEASREKIKAKAMELRDCLN